MPAPTELSLRKLNNAISGARRCAPKLIFIFAYSLMTFSTQNFSALAASLEGNPSVIDGDTLALGNEIIRLHGIDAAETGQRCIAPGRQIVRPGDQAEKRLKELAKDGIKCAGTTHDDFGRLIAKCTSKSGEDINRLLVKEGLAWAFVKYSSDYVADESLAKKAGMGIWSIRCEEPWTFRAKRWLSASQKAPNGCAIKGNISSNGKIYHTPWSNHYTKTSINLAHGERWFCTEGEALRAGWRPPVH